MNLELKSSCSVTLHWTATKTSYGTWSQLNQHICKSRCDTPRCHFLTFHPSIFLLLSWMHFWLYWSEWGFGIKGLPLRHTSLEGDQGSYDTFGQLNQCIHESKYDTLVLFSLVTFHPCVFLPLTSLRFWFHWNVWRSGIRVPARSCCIREPPIFINKLWTTPSTHIHPPWATFFFCTGTITPCIFLWKCISR